MKPFLMVVAILLGPANDAFAATGPKPNVVVILADDLGYGDVHCYNPQRGRIPTPHIDRLAAEGMRFTDAHSSSAVCSPSRYTLLTGRYHWRTRLQSGIVGVYGKPLIAPERLTIAGLLKQHGYRTACIGKWHLGWDWPIPDEKRELFEIDATKAKPSADEEQRNVWREVFSQTIPGGPTTRGFDLYFGTDVPNWPPYCFLDNNQTVGIPSELLPKELLRDNQASLPGPALSGWKLEPILPALGARACGFIEAAAKQSQPFFLYLPLTSPHTPLAVNESWKGKSQLNLYADFVMETDAVVGSILDTLDRAKVAENTLLVITSDNGCAKYIGVAELESKGHFPSGPLRGYKTDISEGGHRIPFVVRWPGVVKPQTICEQLVLQADLIATIAAMLGAKLPENAAEDSVSLLPLLRGENRPLRSHAVNQSAEGLLAIRHGPWKLIFGPHSGGQTPERSSLPAQLYNLADDLTETKNLYAQRPDMVAELTALMERTVNSGRSTLGAPQTNDVPVNWKRFLSAQETRDSK